MNEWLQRRTSFPWRLLSRFSPKNPDVRWRECPWCGRGFVGTVGGSPLCERCQKEWAKRFAMQEAEQWYRQKLQPALEASQ